MYIGQLIVEDTAGTFHAEYPRVVGLTRVINRFSHIPVEPFWDASHAYHCFISSHDSGVGST